MRLVSTRHVGGILAHPTMRVFPRIVEMYRYENQAGAMMRMSPCNYVLGVQVRFKSRSNAAELALEYLVGK